MFENHPLSSKIFDKNSGGQNNVPNNLPTEPDDMLAGVDKVSETTAPQVPNALRSGLLKPKDSATVLPNPDYASSSNSVTDTMGMVKSKTAGVGGIMKIIILILVVVALAAAGFGGWMLYNKYLANSEAEKVQLPPFEVPNQNAANQNVPSTPVTVPTSSVPAVTSPDNTIFNTVDTDQDGLNDEEEKLLKTDSNNPDSDGDKLSDMDEARVWLTDPLKVDTDGDTYSDASEILNGFNPSGPGRFTPPLPIVRFVSSTGATSSYSYTNNPIKTQ